MTERQEKLMLGIFIQLHDTAVTGDGFDVVCKYCSGKEEGYTDSHSFVHRDYCLVLLVNQLKDSMEL